MVVFQVAVCFDEPHGCGTDDVGWVGAAWLPVRSARLQAGQAIHVLCKLLLAGLSGRTAGVPPCRRGSFTNAGLQLLAVCVVFAQSALLLSSKLLALPVYLAGFAASGTPEHLVVNMFPLLLLCRCLCVWSCLLLLLISTCYDGRPIRLAAAAAARGTVL